VRTHAANRAPLVRFFLHPAGKVTLALATIVLMGGVIFIASVWMHYSRLIDEKLKAGPFAQTAKLFAAPEPVAVGDRITFEELEQALRRRGYTQSRSNRIGWFNVREDGVEIFPGVDAWPGSEPGVVFIKAGGVARIVSNRDNTERPVLMIEPELITNLYDTNRQKRRLVRFADIPKVLVEAVLSAEDKRFFQHAGFDPIRLLRTIWVDLSQGKRYGASTLSMQLARGFWLTQEKTWKRKATEALITLQIEQRLTKEQIFEYYANQVDLGRRRSFAVHGFGEASQVYFGKDIRELRLEEAALLAGLIQRPNFLNPYRHPARATQRRNTVLQLMRENGFITELQYIEAARSPLRLAEGGIESTDAPYFVDLVYDHLQDRFADIDFQKSSYRVYTTLDLKLQREAVEAIRLGMQEVDGLLAKRRRKYPEAQVALVALDPATGEVKCLVGGRNYGMSQLNRALAKRQPGSVFKPFVYAAALGSAVNGGVPVVTPVTQVMDEPTVFEFDGKEYTPNNFREQWHGTVTLRQALSKSMNVPTVKFAEMAGFEQVKDLARNAGLETAQATPSIALGAYEVTPLSIAGAYTVFSNGGVYVRENFIREIRTDTGSLVDEAQVEKRAVLDPRVAYMVLDLMQEVVRSGTGAGVRSRGFALPAAGKTGTSHDAWFAGFTSKLLCVVWVGFDNNEELPLEGAKAALPIWTEFMKRAHGFREYRGARPFDPPDGIVTVEIDPLSGKLATSACPKPGAEVFIAGTQPMDLCPLHAGGARTLISSWEDDAAAHPVARSVSGRSSTNVVAETRRVKPGGAGATPGAAAGPAPSEQKKGFWGRIRDIFK
jgi:penicillin-binding protein 1B